MNVLTLFIFVNPKHPCSDISLKYVTCTSVEYLIQIRSVMYCAFALAFPLKKCNAIMFIKIFNYQNKKL